jgi:hypothetical protein
MRKKSERGSVMVETVLSLMVLMPLLMGTSVIGINLVRAIQVRQFCRDVAHLWAYGIDFSKDGNQNLLTHLAQGLGVQKTGGNGVVIFSTVTFVAAADCTAGGLQANTTSCPNLNQAVYVRRIVVGDPSKLTSKFGTPPSNIIQSDGKILAANYLTNKADRVPAFTSLMAVNSGEYKFLTEAYVAAMDLDWKGFMSGTGTYAYNIF